MAKADLLRAMRCSAGLQFLSISNQLNRLDGDENLCTYASGDAG